MSNTRVASLLRDRPKAKCICYVVDGYTTWLTCSHPHYVYEEDCATSRS